MVSDHKFFFVIGHSLHTIEDFGDLIDIVTDL